MAALIPTLHALLAALLLAVGDAPAPARELPRRPPAATAVAAGDIASCDETGDEETAALVRRIGPDAVLTTGDNVYPVGSAEDFAACYDGSWGAFREKTRPSPGNHDYLTPRARGYFRYFRGLAPRAFYSFDLGAWHLVSLNSEIDATWGSRQVRWLRRDLARDRRRCELVYWHRPRWSGGAHGSSEDVQGLWQAAYEAGVDLVLVGHDHNYQRFRRLDARGRPDPRFGVVQVVVGTGGRSHYDPGRIAHRVTADATTFGVLKLRLERRSFGLRFVPVAGGAYEDVMRGGRCHGPPPRRT